MGPNPCFSHSHIVFPYQVLGLLVGPRVCLAKVPFLAPFFFFLVFFCFCLTRTQEGVWPYRGTQDVPLATLIPNI